ncbi:hypothetical protein [Providencia sp.]|uniref:hypothetical protein n=1 Tax=Providencia sp. TaxID=589 RepID=UPI0030105F05
MSKPTGKLIRITPANIGAVPVGRKVNNKPLSGDISLSAGDVGAYSKTETDTRVADAKTAGTNAQNTANGAKTAADKAQTSANTANTAATNANNNANGRVPSGRKVNGKPLSADITLNAGDVGALTQTTADGRYELKGYDPKYQYITVYSGAGMGANQAITLPQDCRGCWFYIIAKNDSVSTSTYLPDDNIEVGINSGASGYARIRLENNGKTFRCILRYDGGEPKQIKVRVRV